MGHIRTVLFIHCVLSDFFPNKHVKQVYLSYWFSKRKQINPEINRNSQEDFGALFITYIAPFFEAMYNLIRDQNQAIRNLKSEDRTVTGVNK